MSSTAVTRIGAMGVEILAGRPPHSQAATTSWGWLHALRQGRLVPTFVFAADTRATIYGRSSCVHSNGGTSFLIYFVAFPVAFSSSGASASSRICGSSMAKAVDTC
eukprot:3237050-Amphidinium_carterae.5